jgi:hypothetical protein
MSTWWDVWLPHFPTPTYYIHIYTHIQWISMINIYKINKYIYMYTYIYICVCVYSTYIYIWIDLYTPHVWPCRLWKPPPREISLLQPWDADEKWGNLCSSVRQRSETPRAGGTNEEGLALWSLSVSVDSGKIIMYLQLSVISMDQGETTRVCICGTHGLGSMENAWSPWMSDFNNQT